MLALLLPSNQAQADRRPGGSHGSGGPEESRGSGGPERYNGQGGSGGYRESRRYPGHGGYNRKDRHPGRNRHGGFEGFLPGLIIGGVLGWGLGPSYYYPPSYDYPPPPEENQPPQSSGQGAENRMFIYPRQGQSEEKQAMDFDACHSWAVNQTDFDPKKPPEGPPDAQRSQKSADYLRAISACLDARGYTLK
jgi:hypothetical protein